MTIAVRAITSSSCEIDSSGFHIRVHRYPNVEDVRPVPEQSAFILESFSLQQCDRNLVLLVRSFIFCSNIYISIIGQELRRLILDLKQFQQVSAKQVIKSLITHHATFLR